jgi:5-deoxy-glucuronate isomerase
MQEHIETFRDGFPQGYTEVTTLAEPSGIAFGVLNLAAGEVWQTVTEGETAFLLMSGDVKAMAGAVERRLARQSLFDESASALHVAAGETVRLTAVEKSELTVYAVRNRRHFPSRFYGPEDVPDEHRGKGQVGDSCYRLVRTIFDRRNADANADLVLGEVVTLQGRWSSYPPHHHPQPEIYHYRFTRPEGYGHAEIGEQVVKVRQYDTIAIPPGLDHAQCAAPGYGMYYSWVIRHLPGDPYTVPEFTAEHRWTTEPGADYWQPRNLRTHA